MDVSNQIQNSSTQSPQVQSTETPSSYHSSSSKQEDEPYLKLPERVINHKFSLNNFGLFNPNYQSQPKNQKTPVSTGEPQSQVVQPPAKAEIGTGGNEIKQPPIFIHGDFPPPVGYPNAPYISYPHSVPVPFDPNYTFMNVPPVDPSSIEQYPPGHSPPYHPASPGYYVFVPCPTDPQGAATPNNITHH